jgi:hypothetical protein
MNALLALIAARRAELEAALRQSEADAANEWKLGLTEEQADQVRAQVLAAAIAAAKQGDREAAAKLAQVRHLPGMDELVAAAAAADPAPEPSSCPPEPPMSDPPPALAANAAHARHLFEERIGVPFPALGG